MQVARGQEVRVGEEYGHQVVGVGMALPASQGGLIGIVDDHRCPGTVALINDMAVVTVGIAVVQLNAVRTPVTSHTRSSCRFKLPVIHRREIAVIAHVQVAPGNLYRTLRTMMAQGLIEESESRPDPALDDERRRYFRLTALGRRLAAAEAARLEELLSSARRRRLLSGSGGIR